jgi:hypothetical protein
VVLFSVEKRSNHIAETEGSSSGIRKKSHTGSSSANSSHNSGDASARSSQKLLQKPPLSRNQKDELKRWWKTGKVYPEIPSDKTCQELADKHSARVLLVKVHFSKL